MSLFYPHPEQFETNAEPSLHADSNRIQYVFDELLGRRGRQFYFLDYLFEKRDEGLSGAVGTVMMPRHEAVVERELAALREKEQSGLAWRYNSLDPVVGWDKWIDSQINKDGASLLYDTAYESKYGDVVRDVAAADDIMEPENIAVVECVRGGRLFNSIEQEFDRIYDSEIQRLVNCAETSGVEKMYATPMRRQ